MKEVLDEIHVMTGLFCSDDSDLANLMVKYLRYNGYKVSSPASGSDINSIPELLNFFYNKCSYKYPEICQTVPSKKKDAGVLSHFIKERMSVLGQSKEAAINDCVLIMKALIYNDKEIGLDRQIGVWVFGTDKCKWITDKAISIVNNNIKKDNQEMVEMEAKKYSEQEAENYKGFNFEECA